METKHATMRAKLVIQSVKPYISGDKTTQESLRFSAVSSTAPYGPNGENEDNTYSRYTPMAELTMAITNPALFGQFKPGQKFYLDFIEAAE